MDIFWLLKNKFYPLTVFDSKVKNPLIFIAIVKGSLICNKMIKGAVSRYFRIFLKSQIWDSKNNGLGLSFKTIYDVYSDGKGGN